MFLKKETNIVFTFEPEHCIFLPEEHKAENKAVLQDNEKSVK